MAASGARRRARSCARRVRAERQTAALTKAACQRATVAAVWARTFAVMLVACAMAALSGCGFADQVADLMPKGFRQPSPEPPAPEPEPDAKELIRANADTLFTAHPGTLAVARPKRITGRGFSVCVKAVVAGAINPEPQPITLVVIIEHGKLTDRRRATAQDGCEGERYDKVDVPRRG